MKSWDAIVVGAGHNGLVNACYLQRAGLDVLVVEKNAWVGGAAVSRSLTPGFLYSNCSYVCSLFRPEIMRDLELPRFGLQVISYEGGAVLTRDGDYLANYRDHHAHRREFARFSKKDAEAYDRYARDVTRQCRFIQPLLDAHRAGSDQLQAARHLRASPSRQEVRRPRRARNGRYAALLDHVDLRLPRRIFRDRRDQGQFRDFRHHRHRARADVAGHGLCAAASLYGRGRRVRGRLGLCARRHGRDHQGARRFVSRLRRNHPHRGRGRSYPCRTRPHDGYRAVRRRGDQGQARRLQRRCEAHLPETRRGKASFPTSSCAG